jgi:hypothetical protein
MRAGLDLGALVALTSPVMQLGSGGQQELATFAVLERCAPRALAQQAGAMMGLSPIARRAQAAAGLMGPQSGATRSCRQRDRWRGLGRHQALGGARPVGRQGGQRCHLCGYQKGPKTAAVSTYREAVVPAAAVWTPRAPKWGRCAGHRGSRRSGMRYRRVRRPSRRRKHVRNR